MKVAIIGSRGLTVDIGAYIPKNTTAIVTGGACGIDSMAEQWADEHGIPKLIIKPRYEQYMTYPYLRCNHTIVDLADMVVAVWDGNSRRVRLTIAYAHMVGKPVKVYEV